MAGNITKVSEVKSNDYTYTRLVVPKSIAQAVGLTKGVQVEWVLIHGDLVIRKLRE
jgi:bifunctional DNA-binding transcriptional regulator/antitoxin component of YhaV-PrlF toxin-antitoxin module